LDDHVDQRFPPLNVQRPSTSSAESRYQAALASLQREHERGLPLFERDD
jgi:hypothetical protein